MTQTTVDPDHGPGGRPRDLGRGGRGRRPRRPDVRGVPRGQRQAGAGAGGQPGGRRQHPGLPPRGQQVRVRRRHPLRRRVRPRRPDADRALRARADRADQVAAPAPRGPLPDHGPRHDVPDADRLGHLPRAADRGLPRRGGRPASLRPDHADHRHPRAAAAASVRAAALGRAADHDADGRLRAQRRRAGGDPRRERRLHLAPAPHARRHARRLPAPLPAGRRVLPARRRPGHRRAPHRRRPVLRRPGPHQGAGRADPDRGRSRRRRTTAWR